MKFVSWNVNGLRAALRKDFEKIFAEQDADFFCLQETKLQPDQVTFHPEGYESYWYSADKKGYSGVGIYTRHTPLTVARGIGIDEHDHEGRVLTLEYEDFYLVTVYSPNSQDGLRRLDYRVAWEEAFGKYLASLDAKKPVIVCGDMNVAHEEIDLKHPKENIGSTGFTDQERGAFHALLENGMVDTWRHLNPDKEGVYTWWSYRFRAREHNNGWRIDYFLISERLLPRLRDAGILTDVAGSDHCPVTLTLDETAQK